MRRYYLQSGLWMGVLTLLILGGLYVAADLNATDRPSNTLNIANIDSGYWSDTGPGFVSGEISGRSTKIVAQNSFSLSLDANSAAGDQGVASINVSPDQDQVVSIQVFGSSIQNARGFGIHFEYDASQVSYEGFDVGSVLPGTPQFLAEHGTNPTSVTIGIASFSGPATVSSGLVGTIRFLTTTGFSGTAVQLVRAELSRSGQSEVVMLAGRVELGVSPASSSDFDGDGRVGISDFLQFVNHFETSPGDAGYDAKYDLDGNDVVGMSDFLIFANNFGSQVPPSGGGATVTIADANLRAVIADSLGKASGTPITRAEMATLTRLEAPNSNISDLIGLEHATNLQRLGLGRVRVNNEWVNSNDISNLSPLSNLTNLTYLSLTSNSISDISVLSNLTNLTYLGLSGNSISDISPLVANTGLGSGDTVDLKSNPLSSTSINTHIPALQRRGVTVEFDSSSGSGGSSSPDLIVESPSVSDNTLTTGQSFTLSATVRNQGTGSSAATTLRYYRSSNSTISTSDTEVGTDAVGSLNSSGSSAESISLNAPSSAGTYYYGACVNSVTGESDTDNNCSDAVSVTVSSSSGSGGNLGSCAVGMVVSPNQRCSISGGEFINLGDGCFTYTPFGSGRFCTGSFNLNGFRGTRVGNDFRIDALP